MTPPSPIPDGEREEAPTVALRFETLPPVERGSSLSAEWWIAWNHLRSKKSDRFLSVATVLSVLAVVVAVAVLNWVIAVMTGFEIDLRDKILGANAHVVVFRHGGNVQDVEAQVQKVLEVDGVEAAAPFVYTEMMIRSPFGSTGIVLKGMDPARTGAVTHVLGDLVEGYDASHARIVKYGEGDVATRTAAIERFAEPFPAIGPDQVAVADSEADPALPGIVIGKELRSQLQVRPGDVVQLINPMGGAPGPMGVPTPSVRSLRVAAVFDSGMYEYDTKWTYTTNTWAQQFLGLGESVTAIEIRVSDIDGVESLARELDAKLGYPYYARHWQNLNEKLFAALALEKWVMGLLLQVTVFNAGLLIISTLIMVVITKGREIAILKAVGATQGTILRLFLMQGAAIGAVGTLLGTAAGLGGCWFLDRYEYPLETDVYYLDTLPVVVDPTAVAVIAVGAFVICVLCTVYPARRAAAIDPVAALRYE